MQGRLKNEDDITFPPHTRAEDPLFPFVSASTSTYLFPTCLAKCNIFRMFRRREITRCSKCWVTERVAGNDKARARSLTQTGTTYSARRRGRRLGFTNKTILHYEENEETPLFLLPLLCLLLGVKDKGKESTAPCMQHSNIAAVLRLVQSPLFSS